jgi:4'-phosphopantetheinyl transferase
MGHVAAVVVTSASSTIVVPSSMMRRMANAAEGTGKHGHTLGKMLRLFLYSRSSHSASCGRASCWARISDVDENAVAFPLWPERRLPSRHLADDQVELWAIQLDVSTEMMERLGATLHPQERERAQRFVFERDRGRFLVARGFLRRLLSVYTGTPAARHRITYGPRGKPGLQASPSRRLQFNLAHSGEMAVFAFASTLPLGVDIEEVRPIEDLLSIARSTFTAGEVRTLVDLGARDRAPAFFRCWTRKEAYVKAVGEGLYLPLDSFEVSLRPGEKAEITAGVGRNEWSLYHLEPAEGYVGALAVPKGPQRCTGWLVDAALLDLEAAGR